MTGTSLLEKHKDLARRKTREEFAVEVEGCFLLWEPPSEGAEDGGFFTGVVSIDVLKARHDASADRPAASPEVFLAKVSKRAENSWLTWITVGRAGNNDIVIKHPSVSKLHARIDTSAPISADHELADRSGFWITDTGSKNGTSVNGTKLDKGAPRAIRPGDRLSFGEVVARFCDAGLLHDEIARRF